MLKPHTSILSPIWWFSVDFNLLFDLTCLSGLIILSNLCLLHKHNMNQKVHSNCEDSSLNLSSSLIIRFGKVIHHFFYCELGNYKWSKPHVRSLNWWYMLFIIAIRIIKGYEYRFHTKIDTIIGQIGMRQFQYIWVMKM